MEAASACNKLLLLSEGLSMWSCTEFDGKIGIYFGHFVPKLGDAGLWDKGPYLMVIRRILNFEFAEILLSLFYACRAPDNLASVALPIKLRSVGMLDRRAARRVSASFWSGY